MKTTVFVVLGLVIGIVAGAGGMHQWLMPQILELDFALGESNRALAAFQSDGGGGARLARLEAERKGYEQTLSDLRSEVDSLQNTAEVAPATSEAALIEEPVDAATNESADPPPDRGRRGSPWDRGGTPEERDARRQEFVTRMQDNLTDFFTGELEKSNTPEVQERLIALETTVHDMMDIRRQMRDVETDEERDALRASFGDTMDTARGIMKDQQRDMINAIAGQFNISSRADKAAFQQAVQAAVESPFFSDNPGALLWGGGRPGGYGSSRRRP
jgi:hypothetical protein